MFYILNLHGIVYLQAKQTKICNSGHLIFSKLYWGNIDIECSIILPVCR